MIIPHGKVCTSGNMWVCYNLIAKMGINYKLNGQQMKPFIYWHTNVSKALFSLVFYKPLWTKFGQSKYIGVFALLDYKCKNLGQGYVTKCGGKL